VSEAVKYKKLVPFTAITALVRRHPDSTMPVSHWFLNTGRNLIQKPNCYSRSHIYCHLRIPLFRNPLVLTAEALKLGQLIYTDLKKSS